MAKFCTHCGAALEEGARFCVECGQRIEEEEAPATKPGTPVSPAPAAPAQPDAAPAAKKKSPLAAIVAAVAIVAVLAVVLFVKPGLLVERGEDDGAPKQETVEQEKPAKTEEPSPAKPTEKTPRGEPAPAPAAPVQVYSDEELAVIYLDAARALAAATPEEPWSEARVKLYDIDGDGVKELLAIDNQNMAMATGRIFTVDGRGEAEEIFRSDPVGLAGAGSCGFSLITYQGETYPVFTESNYDDPRAYEYLYLLVYRGGGLAKEHVLYTDEVYTDDYADVSSHYQFDGRDITVLEGERILRTREDLVSLFDNFDNTTGSMSRGAFLAMAGSEEPALMRQQRLCLERAYDGAAALVLRQGNEELFHASVTIGSNGISYSKQEGDRCTPAGTFHLLYYISDNDLGLLMPCRLIPQNGDTWICNPDSKFYNTLQFASDMSDADLKGAESMTKKFADGKSEYCLVFDYNGDGITTYSATPGAGSAIFIDGVGSGGTLDAGYGDIKMAAADMVRLLRLLDPACDPVVIIS